MTRLARLLAGQLAPAVNEEGRGEGGVGALEAVELAIRAAMLGLGGSLLGLLLAGDLGHRGPRVDCGHGHEAGFVAYRPTTIHTVLGPVRLRRAWYHCTTCRHGHAPRDEQLGVVGTSLSPGLRRMIDRVGATAPFAPAGRLLGDLAGLVVNAKRVQRTAEADGQNAAAMIEARAEAIRARTLIPLPPSPLPDILYTAIDGTGVPMTSAEIEDRPAKTDRPGLPDDGRARTREVKLACVFTQSTFDDEGRPVRDRESSSYLASFATAAEFAPLVAAEARRRGAEHIRQLVVLGDGAVWIWNLATKILPAATQIVDIYHAREHLHALAATLAFIVTDPQQWLKDRLDELDAGNIEAIIAAAREYDLVGLKATDRDKALNYFETNTVRMRYGRYRQLGLFIGSGTVEAGCKAVIGQRLKLSGMRWTKPGATGILTLRCQQASNQWDEIWTPPNNQTPTTHLAPCGT